MMLSNEAERSPDRPILRDFSAPSIYVAIRKPPYADLLVNDPPPRLFALSDAFAERLIAGLKSQISNGNPLITGNAIAPPIVTNRFHNAVTAMFPESVVKLVRRHQNHVRNLGFVSVNTYLVVPPSEQLPLVKGAGGERFVMELLHVKEPLADILAGIYLLGCRYPHKDEVVEIRFGQEKNSTSGKKKKNVVAKNSARGKKEKCAIGPISTTDAARTHAESLASADVVNKDDTLLETFTAGLSSGMSLDAQPREFHTLSVNRHATLPVTEDPLIDEDTLQLLVGLVPNNIGTLASGLVAAGWSAAAGASTAVNDAELLSKYARYNHAAKKLSASAGKVTSRDVGTTTRPTTATAAGAPSPLACGAMACITPLMLDGSLILQDLYSCSTGALPTNQLPERLGKRLSCMGINVAGTGGGAMLGALLLVPLVGTSAAPVVGSIAGATLASSLLASMESLQIK